MFLSFGFCDTPLYSNIMTLVLCDYHPGPPPMSSRGFMLLLGSFWFWLDLPSTEIWGRGGVSWNLLSFLLECESQGTGV